MCRLLMCSLLRCARWGLFLPLLCLLVLLPAATSSASETPATYQITAAELTELQDNLSRLQLINDSLRQTCGLQQNRLVDLATALTEAERQLTKAKEQQTALQAELTSLKSLSKMQAESLEKANKSFETFAAEEKARRLRIKAQRNTWAAAAGLLAVGFALK